MHKHISPQELLPHGSRMCVIDDIISANDDKAICQLTVKKSNIFYNDKIQGIYNWFGIEFMAQAIGIYAGYQGESNKPEVGLLLSVRKFKSHCEYFNLNNILIITAKKSFIGGKIGVFNCYIHIDNQLACEARLNTYLPPKEQISDILTGKLKL